MENNSNAEQAATVAPATQGMEVRRRALKRPNITIRKPRSTSSSQCRHAGRSSSRSVSRHPNKILRKKSRSVVRSRSCTRRMKNNANELNNSASVKQEVKRCIVTLIGANSFDFNE
ncbi:unnamed protein product [Calicophoron daubneyi]|uniref:Uncharacterized protein n=1 Tax=Calicophoron daubneyi TaxID=300641 RepID=A0AAV2U0D8_CALDB